MRNRQTVSAQDGSSDFDEDEGEELDDIEASGREPREALSLDARRGNNDGGGGLSMDLAQGFRDDSDDDSDIVDTRRRSMSRSRG